MRHRSLRVVGKLCRRGVERRIPEDRIVAKAMRAGGRRGDLTFDDGLGFEQDFVPVRDGQAGNESRRSGFALDTSENLREASRI